MSVPSRRRASSQGPHFTRAYAETGTEMATAKPGTPILYRASTPGVKRDGMDLRASGWLTRNFIRAGGPVLWCHDYSIPQIGRADAKADGQQLMTPVWYDQEDPFAVKVESKTRRGFGGACSVGWDFVNREGQPLDYWRMSNDALTNSAHYDMLELSIVPVGSDADAMAVRARLRRISPRLAELYDDQERPDSDAIAVDVHTEVLAACVRLGIPLDLAHWAPIQRAPQATSAPAAVDQNAAQAVLAAFNPQGAS